MNTVKEGLEVEEDFPPTDPEDPTDQDEIVVPPLEVAKTNLAKRRTIDALLEERRLRKELEDYGYDL